ncbi:MAG: hypothetical protein PX483_13430, partial [Nostocales cyanobacterium LE14-WE4]|nr:hypothetical protein [Nostocales cyanobacterium LE14-WE4]
MRPYSNGFCPQCRGELRSPKRYIIKAQVPKRDSASTDLSVRPTKNLGTEVRSLVGRFTMVG